MGKRGFQPTPTAILKLRGSHNIRKDPESEPRPASGAPVEPSMPSSAVEVWRQVMPLLESCGVLTQVDGNPLERYSRLMVLWRLAMDVLEGDGLTFEHLAGNTLTEKLRHEFKVVQQLGIALLQLETAFGMTPSSRSRITIPKNGGSKDAGQPGDQYFA